MFFEILNFTEKNCFFCLENILYFCRKFLITKKV
jgi:hypothetical protein